MVVLMILAIQLVASPASATGVYEVPALAAGDKTWVVDQAEILSRVSEGTISSTLEELAQKTGNQVRVVTIHRLDYGETPESLANQLFEKWFPPEVQANQTVLVLDNVTNGAAIWAGEKAKSLLSDAAARSIVEETLMVPIRKGNYNQGLMDGVDRLAAILSGQPDPGPPQVVEVVRTEGTFKKADETNRGGATVVVVVLLLAATVIPMATYYFYQYMQSQ
ncbi:TPM domain-containing protein [Leptolyngbya sp. 'hensonii']|uniref:photosystem II repair protein Psb32 n=1 Tax=Leptolyngbya sp. 'hensonii' TaxID=1922337 RepID=UPI00209B7CF2|nr:TPM domain-containing protein [Leptolyngbya sp. 'hensonii']